MTESLPSLFRRCSVTLLDPASDHGERFAAVQALHSALCGALELDDARPANDEQESTRLALGTAVSVQMAARCLREYQRTARFLQGVAAAVGEARRRFPGERIRLLEAGCGPFGLLALPLSVRFAPEELGFVLLDYHGRSLAAVRQLTRLLGLEDYVIDTVQADATRWQCPPALRPHVLVSETMRASLSDEPQVAVVANLAPQMMPDGIMVPESIQVDACLFHQGDPVDAKTRSWIELGPLFELTKDKAGKPFPLRELTLPDEVPGNYDLVTRTRIRLFGDIWLQPFECSLTLNRVVRELCRLRGGERIAARYALEPQPGFQWQEPIRG
ncbi:MAG TPA: class I SAM-dependent methyltransferase [Gammaproteobacteria bacterium]|nr:class I SAM-dependent methyltransferase [Gammaproteobacteria bacterium]